MAKVIPSLVVDCLKSSGFTSFGGVITFRWPLLLGYGGVITLRSLRYTSRCGAS